MKSFWQRYFSKEGDTFQQALTEFSKTVMLIVDLEQLKDNVIGKIREIVKVEKILIVLLDADTERFQVVKSRGYEKSELYRVRFSSEDRLIQWLMVNNTHLAVAENPGVMEYLNQRERDMLFDYGIELVFPLVTMNRITGMVWIGSKINEQKFSSDEIELLSMLFSQAALAFENAYLYHQQENRLRRMYRADRLAILGQIAAGAAHEIRNPLASIRSTIQYFQKKSANKKSQDITAGLLEEVDRINGIIQGLLSFAKPTATQIERVDLGVLLKQTIVLIHTTAKKQRVEVSLEKSDSPANVHGDQAQLKQVFLNILMNGLQAMPEGGILAISLSRAPASKASTMKYLLEFKDTGSGINAKNIDQVFDPFFTTKKEGTGLGLSISYGIIQQHGGEIEVGNYIEGERSGTRVLIRLPEKALQKE